MLRAALTAIFRRLSAIYFREIEVVGEVPSRHVGGRIFVANHVNGLVDPILVLTHAPCPIAPVGKSTLWKIPVLRWLLDAADAVPIERRRDNPDKSPAANEAVFDRIAEHLSRGKNVLIFPEGTSHNEPHLAPLKTGAARMLARAKAGGARGLTFQAVGLEFDARDKFRSRALVVYGPVRAVDAIDEASGDALVQAITEQMRADLSELIVEGTTWEEYRLVARVAELFMHESDRTLARWNEIGRQVEAARKALGPEQDAIYGEVATAVGRYYDALDAEGVTDEEVVRGGPIVRSRRLRRKAALALALPLAIPGALLYAAPYQLPRFVATFAGDELDRVSTYKLATGLFAYPLWACGLVAAAFALLPLALAGLASVVVVVSPFAALAWLDHLERHRGAASSDLARLRADRVAATAVLARARARV